MTKAAQTLWDNAQTGNYPPSTTSADLANIKDTNGRTALHEAAYYRHLPTGTTAHDLATAKDPYGWSALHIAAAYNHLPPDTTSTLLKTTCDSSHNSAWRFLCDFSKNNPKTALQLPHTLFKNDSEGAIQITEIIKTARPSLTSKAAIWLGNILATNQPQKTKHTTTAQEIADCVGSPHKFEK